ncbi:MAG: PKD domain-containing protein [Bacteroidetes bacterium]|nr:PKD domain-containing protein [Bacteroidota bacterium]
MKKILLSLILILITGIVQATHIRGGVITYEHISGKKYTVYVKIWRDCNGIPISQSNLAVLNDTLGSIGSITNQTKVYVRDISMIDSSASCGAKSNCQISGGQGGFEEHLWKMTVDFSSYYPNCAFYLVWTQAGRSNAITTGAANSYFYINAYINLCYDSSSRSVLNRTYPDITLDYNYNHIINPGFYQKEDYFDSIGYELVPALSGPTTSVTYSGNFSELRPMTFFGFPNYNLGFPAGFHLDPGTGTLLFRPSQVNQVAVVTIMHKGYKSVNDTMRLVSFTRYEFDPVVLNRSTNGHMSVFENPRTLTHYVCEGTTACIDVLYTATYNDSVYYKGYINNPRISIDTLLYTVDSVRLRYCMTPDSTDWGWGVNTVLSEIVSNYCPDTRRFNFQRQFVMVPSPDSSKIPSWYTERNCNTLSLIVSDTAQSGKDCYIKRDGATSYSLDTAIIQLQSSDTGWFKYHVMQDWLGCQLVFEDSVYIRQIYNLQLNPNLPIKACANDTLVLHGNPSGGMAAESWLWSDSTTADSFSIFINQDTTVWVSLLDSSGCFISDTFHIRMDSALSVYTPVISICTELKNASVQLSSQVDGGTKPYTYSWLGLGQGNNYSYVPPAQDTSIVILVNDSVNCSIYDTLAIDRYVPHYPQAMNDTVGCQLGALYLKDNDKVNYGTYKWTYGPPGDDSIRLYPPLGYTTRILKYTDTLSCSTYDTVNILNKAKPKVFLPRDTVLCSGSSLQIDAITYKGVPPFIYSWKPNTQVTDTFIVNTYYQSSRVYVKLEDSSGCTSEDSMDIVVNSIPQISGNSPYSICRADSMIQLSSLSGNLNGTWYGNGVSQSGGSDVFKVDGLISGTYWTYFNSLNSSGACTAKDSLEIYLLESPVAFAGNDTGICGNGNLVFHGQGMGGNSGYHFRWNSDSVLNIDSLTYQVISDTAAYLEIWDANGCYAEDSIQVSKYIVPLARFTVPLSDTSICKGDTLSILYDSSSSPMGSAYQLDPSPANLSHYVPNSSGALHLKVTTVEGCTDRDTLNITLNALPVILSMDTALYCEDMSGIMIDSLANPVGGIWSGMGISWDSVHYYFDPQSGGPGKYRLFYVLVDSNHCASYDSTFVGVEEKSAVAFSSDSVYGRYTLHTQFTNTSIGGSPVSYLWDFGDGDSSLLENASHVYNQIGFFDVRLTLNGMACQSTLLKSAYIQVDSNGGVAVILPGEERIEVYPNPSNGIYRIKGLNENVSLKVFDAEGREIPFAQSYYGNSIQIELISSVPGIYWLQIDNRRQLYRIKLVKLNH